MLRSVLMVGAVIAASCLTSVCQAQEAKSKLAGEAQKILQQACHRCHGADGTVEGGFSYVLDRQQLVSRKQIQPGMADKSRLIRRITSGEMPPEGESPTLSKDQIATLIKWVDSGAPDFNESKPDRIFVTAADMIKTMAADLKEREAADRKFARYIILTHLYNAGRSADEILSFQHGVSKLVNSLSWGRRVVKPALIGSPPTLLRIDLRDYKWSAAVWDRLAAADPYGLEYANIAQAKTIYSDTGCELPYIRGDWFVAAASRPPLYHQILQLPDTEKELEALIHVDVEENIRTAQVIRAGFNGSAVSRNNRLIERHESSYGYYWKSYDFAKNVDRQNLFSHPLGPGSSASHFRHDGGELIFSLPNGFQGYLLVNGAGKRIDKGPTEIVSDPRQPDRAVENGLSCMTCHVKGMLPKDDQIRAHVEKNPTAFSKKELEAVLALYPAQQRFQMLLQEDAERFRTATEQAGLPPAISEPIKALATLFESELDLPLAAAEAGLKPEDFQKLLTKFPALGRELGSLQTTGGTVQRETFVNNFAAVARAAKIGTPMHRSTVVVKVDSDASDDHVDAQPKDSPIADDWIQLGGRHKFPAFFQSNPAILSEKTGLSIKRRNYVLSRKGDFLSKDFKFEIVFTLKDGDANDIAFVGMGEADRNSAYNEPKNSVYLGIHPPTVEQGRVSLSNRTGGGGTTLGNISRPGTHRAIIEKIGDAVTFSIDVDNDGPSDDDLENAVPDIKEFGTYLHKKNTFLFFGGGGVYHRLRLSAPGSSDAAAPAEEKIAAPDPKETKGGLSQAKHVLLGRSGALPAPWSTKSAVNKDKAGGIRINKNGLVISKDGNYLKKDFTFEAVIAMKEGDGIGLMGIGNVNANASTNISQAILYRIHPPGVSEGQVYMTAKDQTLGLVGACNKPGTHLFRVKKEGDSLTFSVDIDNDGESPEDAEYTIPDVKEFAPFLHEKNTYLFFGHGGLFKSTRVVIEK